LDAGRSEQAGHGQGELGAEASWARLAGGELGAVGRGRAGRGRPEASWARSAGGELVAGGGGVGLQGLGARAAGWAGVWLAERDKGEREKGVSAAGELAS
jgi:hypothetical protein